MTLNNPSEGFLPQRLGPPIASVDDLTLYKEALIYKGQIIELTDVTSVDGASVSTTVNLIPIIKSSSLIVEIRGGILLGGETIVLDEERKLFGKKHHQAIANMRYHVQQATFKSRLTKLMTKLSQERRVKIYEPLLPKKYLFGDSEEPVYVTAEGKLTTSSRSYDLKSAKKAGTFGVGTHLKTLGLSQQYDSNEVVIFEEKTIIGSIPRNALKFHVNTENYDITHTLLLWLAEPGNAI